MQMLIVNTERISRNLVEKNVYVKEHDTFLKVELS